MPRIVLRCEVTYGARHARRPRRASRPRASANRRVQCAARAHRVTLRPAQGAGRHVHPGGVIGYVLEGEIIFQIEGQPATTLRGGSAFYEPPGATIIHFDNASTIAPAIYLAFYTLSGNQPLITMQE